MKCNICGNGNFIPGPNGRLSRGVSPMCQKCLSLERHRAIRVCYNSIIKNSSDLLIKARCIQFAKDVSVDPKWFNKWDYSEYGGHNSLNIMDIKLQSETVDWFVLNHILEHVLDDTAALKELIRCCTNEGVIQFTVPSPLWHFKTNDWGYPDPQRIFHYREYGSDIIKKMFQISTENDFFSMVALPQDPVTHISDAVFFVSKSENILEVLFNIFIGNGIITLRIL